MRSDLLLLAGLLTRFSTAAGPCRAATKSITALDYEPTTTMDTESTTTPTEDSFSTSTIRPTSTVVTESTSISATESTVLSTPSSTTQQATCTLDNCLGLVFETSSDCASFMGTTVTLCPTTTSATITVTMTDDPVSITVTQQVTDVQVETDIETLTVVETTLLDTATVLQPTEVDVTNTLIVPVTVPALPITTVPADKRELNARVPTTISIDRCSATTSSGGLVPTYASTCSGAVRFSSACSCAGITGGSTVLPQETITSTTTVTVHSAATVTVTDVNTMEISSTIAETSIVPTTLETTIATIVIPEPFTVTTNIQVASTVTASAPLCSTYKIQVTSGANAGVYLDAGLPPAGSTSGYVTFVGTEAQASVLTIGADGGVYTGGTFAWATMYDNAYYVMDMTDENIVSAAKDHVGKIICSVSGSSLSCSVPAVQEQAYFYMCSSTSGNNLMVAIIDEAPGCTPIVLGVTQSGC